MLEAKIDQLNKNLEYLNCLLEVMADTSKANTVTAEPKEVTTDDPEPETKTGFGHADIKSMALDICKKDRAKRDDIKAKLSEFGAKVATDLNEADTQTVGDWLTTLKEEVGA